MRRTLAVIILAVLLCTILLVAWRGNRPKVWAQEPSTYLGIKLGEPLSSSSIPACVPNDKRLCFDGDYIVNEPDPVSATKPIIEDGIVTMVTTNFRPDAEALIRRDLREKYGDPQSTYPDDTWKGKTITVRIMKPTGDSSGLLMAALVDGAQRPGAPHKNPF